MTTIDTVGAEWVAVARSEEVSPGPLGVKAASVALVLFRERDGRIAALEDRCPHVGFILSDGSVVAGEIECGYHGLRFDGTGTCTLMPCAPGPPDRFRVRSFPAIERDGRILVNVSEAASPPA